MISSKPSALFWVILVCLGMTPWAQNGDVNLDSTVQTPLHDPLAQYKSESGISALWRKALQSLGASGSITHRGNQAYREKDYDNALQHYAEGLLDAPESQALHLNTGNALFRKRKYPEAITSFKHALQGDNAEIAAKAWYNLGNSYFRQGEFSIGQGKQEGISDYREALAAYKKSLEIRPSNADAKRNIEVVQARIKELLDRQKQNQQQQQQQPGKPKPPPQPSAAAQQALARALQLVAQRHYAEAKAVLEDILIKDPTAESYKSHVQRIEDVLKILKGETPANPSPQDPRAQQPGMGVI